MKKLLLLVFLVTALVASGQEKIVESGISGVVVYLDRAQVSRVAKVRVEPGKTQVVFSSLSSTLDPNSIQVSGKGDAIIQGINHRLNYLQELNLPRPIRVLKDSVAWLQRQIIIEQGQKENLAKEEQLLLSNQRIGGGNTNLTAAELKAMADFFRSRMGEIIVTRQRQEERIRSLNDKLSRTSAQYNELNELYNRSTSEVVVTLESAAGALVELQLNYVVANAGWIPIYDLRAKDTRSPVELFYKAQVFQATGEEWKNVRLTLSTMNPTLGGVKPQLNRWVLNARPEKEKNIVYRATSTPRFRGDVSESKAMPEKEEKPLESMADYTSKIQTALATSFVLNTPYTVLSSNKPTQVDIAHYPLNSFYHYAAVPKLDEDVFLLAGVTGWEVLSLLPGEANIFFEGTFVTKSQINPGEIGDTLNISLGRDKRIVMKREKLKDFTSRKVIGSMRKESFAYEISLRNTRTEPLEILVEDQIPVSRTTSIEVSLTDAGNAKYTFENGKLQWTLTLQPNETRKLIYKFEVRYPKSIQIDGL